MSIRTISQTCCQCGRVYDFNPSVGKYRCPHCAGKSSGMTIGGIRRIAISESFPRKRLKDMSCYSYRKKQG